MTLIVLNAIVALVLTLFLGKMHEVIHAVIAKRLGYKVTGFTLWKNEVDIDINDDDPNLKKITRAPYYILVPIGFLLIALGIHMYNIRNDFFLGIIVSGVAIIFLHTLSFKFEKADVDTYGKKSSNR